MGKTMNKKPKLDIINQSMKIDATNRGRGISEAVDPNENGYENEDSLIIFKNNSKPTNSLMIIKESVRFKMIFYDFDQTITVIHLYKELKKIKEGKLENMSDERLIEIFGGKERVRRLHGHFEKLKARDISLYVLSFNWSMVIEQALERMDLMQYFDVIIGRDSEEIQIAEGKKAKYVAS